jgi:hypothetical protein
MTKSKGFKKSFHNSRSDPVYTVNPSEKTQPPKPLDISYWLLAVNPTTPYSSIFRFFSLFANSQKQKAKGFVKQQIARIVFSRGLSAVSRELFSSFHISMSDPVDTVDSN